MALNQKQRVFVEEYLTCWNATEAARRAGYAHPNMAGPRLMVKDSIQEVVKQRISEKTMGADEVLTRLAEQARAEYADFATPRGIDIKRLVEAGKARLIKKWSYNQMGYPILEFYDAQNALLHIGKHLKLFEEPATSVTLNVVGLERLMDKVYGAGNNDQG